MALTIGDANDVQTLIRYLYGIPDLTGATVDVDRAEQVAQRLAGRSSKALMAGLSTDALRAYSLPHREVRTTAPGHAHGCLGYDNHGRSDCPTDCRCVCHQPPLS